LAPHLSYHYLTLWHGPALVPGILQFATQNQDPLPDVIPTHQLMLFRHITAYYDIIGPHDPSGGRHFTTLNHYASLHYDFPFATFTTFPTAIGPFSSSHGCPRKSISSPSLPHGSPVPPQGTIVCGKISLLDIWIPQFMSQCHQIIYNLTPVSTSPEKYISDSPVIIIS
jgi:hypothetical protein